MKTSFGLLVFTYCLFAGYTPAAVAANDAGPADDIQLLRQEIKHLRLDYEARIAELERRLDTAGQGLSQAAPQAPVSAPPVPYASAPAAEPPVSTVSSSGRNNAFNPAIGVTFQGQAWSYDNDPGGRFIPGFPRGGEAGLAPEGLSLAESEISMSANVDDKFTAMLTVPVVVEDGEAFAELEEAWVETTALPAGLSVRMGRFYSNIGYLNSWHSHAWDFVNQPLAYEAFLGSQYFDDGVQLRWLAPTDFYLELGGELFRGDTFPAAGAGHSGIGSSSLTAKTGGDLGLSHSWLFGLSWFNAEAIERESGTEDEPLAFTGDTEMVIASLVWKWAPYGNARERSFKFQAEYLWRNEDGHYGLPSGAAEPWDENQQGWYAQAIYQPLPRWRLGLRYDQLSGGTADQAFVATPLYSAGSDPQRYSLMVDWSNSEFSRLRFQYEYDQSGLDDDNQFAVQYIFSIGAHGAHAF